MRKININWKRLIISIGIGIIFAVLFLALVGFSWIDEVCVEDDEYESGSSVAIPPSEKGIGTGRQFCEITLGVVYGGSITIVVLSMFFFYFLIGYLQKRKNPKND